MDDTSAKKPGWRIPVIVLGVLVVLALVVLAWLMLGEGWGLLGTWQSGEAKVAFGLGGRGSTAQAGGDRQLFSWRVRRDVLTIRTEAYTRTFDMQWESKDRLILRERWKADAEKLTFTRVRE